MKPPPGHERKLAEIAAREGRHNIPRSSWDARDWRVQREQDAARRARKAKLIADMDRPVVTLPTLTVAAGFSLTDRSADEERQRRIRANRALQKAGVRQKSWW